MTIGWQRRRQVRRGTKTGRHFTPASLPGALLWADFHTPGGPLDSQGNATPKFCTVVEETLGANETLFTSWTTDNVATPVQGEADPDGGSSAWSVVEDSTAADTHGLTISAPNLGTALPVWVYATAKSNGRDLIRLDAGGSDWALFDLSDGTVDSTSGASVLTSVQDLGGGHYRCSARVTLGSTISLLMHDGTSTTYDGDGTSGIILTEVQTYQPRIASYTCRVTGQVVASATAAYQGISNLGSTPGCLFLSSPPAGAAYANTNAAARAGIAGSQTLVWSGKQVTAAYSTLFYMFDTHQFILARNGGGRDHVQRVGPDTTDTMFFDDASPASGPRVTMGGINSGTIFGSVNNGTLITQAANAIAPGVPGYIQAPQAVRCEISDMVAYGRALDADERTALYEYLAPRIA